MKYDEIYELHSSLILDSGIELTLNSIYQTRVYKGLLEGVPNVRSNVDTVKRIIKLAKERECIDGEEPLLITPVTRNQSSVDEDPDYEPYGDEEWLPGIVSIATFSSMYTINSDSDFTELCVIWFQDDFPIDVKSLKAINWADLAYDKEW